VQQRRDVSVVEGSLRALLSLSYLDSVAMWLGVDAGMIPLFIGFLISPLYSRESMRYSLEILCNLCLHHANRRIIYDNGGIDAIVSLHIDNQPHIRDLSVSIIGHLEDITPAEVLARVKVDIGLERMVTLAASQDPLVRAVAAESIGEEIWSDPRKQRRAHEIGGVDVLLAIIANKDEPVESVLPALHSLRNIIQNNVDAQTQFSYRDGLSVVAELIRKAFSGFFAEQTEKVLEAALHCLKFGVLNHERNSRKLLMVGLDAVMDVAEGPTSAKAKAADAYVRQGLRSEGVVALAKDIQLILGEYNYVVCRHCGKRQNLHGTTCLMCGYRLLVEVDQTDAAFLKTLSKLSPAVPLSGTAGVGIAAGAVAKLTDSSSRKSMNSKHPAMRHLAASASMPDIVPFVGHKTLPSGERAEQLTGLGGDEIKKKRSLASSSAKEQLSQTTR
jgi:DNA-directed RNA polymerase subunit RPC12/RpoP